MRRRCRFHGHRAGRHLLYLRDHRRCDGHWVCRECARRLERAGERVEPSTYPPRLFAA